MVEDGAKLQALVYDILPLEEGAEKLCSECGDEGWGGWRGGEVAVAFYALTPAKDGKHLTVSKKMT